VLGAMMQAEKTTKNESPSLLDVVALLTDLPGQRLARGQVGTIVEQLDDKTSLVEFSDDQGRAYALAPCPRDDLLVLHYVPEAAWRSNGSAETDAPAGRSVLWRKMARHSE
jgi:Domain of unknown function (DUF4926)